jgi:hypothetical protein
MTVDFAGDQTHAADLADQKDWLFKPVEHRHGQGGQRSVAEDAPAGSRYVPGTLDPRPGDNWHGFDDIAEGGACSIRSRSASSRQEWARRKARKDRRAGGLVNAWFNRWHRAHPRHGFSGDVPVLVRHHPGKWGTLLTNLLAFKRLIRTSRLSRRCGDCRSVDLIAMSAARSR